MERWKGQKSVKVALGVLVWKAEHVIHRASVMIYTVSILAMRCVGAGETFVKTEWAGVND